MRVTKNIIAIILIALYSCSSSLDEISYSQLDPNGLFATEEGMNSVLLSAYAEVNLNEHDGKSIMNLEDWTTDIEWETGGGENRIASEMISFTFSPSNEWITDRMWNRFYRAINITNVVIENTETANFSDDLKTAYISEARFLRAVAYYRLYTWFGPPILRTSTEDPLNMQRSSEEEITSFIENEFLAVLPLLPEPGSETKYGKAHTGAVRAFLTKFYLNTKQWEKCGYMAKEVIDMSTYELYPTYEDLFRVENERNSEYIWAATCVEDLRGNLYISGAFPPGYHTTVNGEGVWSSAMRNWAANYRIYDDFYNSFEEGDRRRNLILSEYLSLNGDHISLLGDDNTRSFKYWPDPNAVAQHHGNDAPEIRYADILLARAEALNEVNGPNQESIDLINVVRNRAGLSDLIVNDFDSKDDLRDHILSERGWEFYNERIRRQDLIRHGKYIVLAQERGHAAKAHHVRFPIPLSEIDANPMCIQNEGY